LSGELKTRSISFETFRREGRTIPIQREIVPWMPIDFSQKNRKHSPFISNFQILESYRRCITPPHPLFSPQFSHPTDLPLIFILSYSGRKYPVLSETVKVIPFPSRQDFDQFSSNHPPSHLISLIYPSKSVTMKGYNTSRIHHLSHNISDPTHRNCGRLRSKWDPKQETKVISRKNKQKWDAVQ
jgi:hypothetical protein